MICYSDTILNMDLRSLILYILCNFYLLEHQIIDSIHKYAVVLRISGKSNAYFYILIFYRQQFLQAIYVGGAGAVVGNGLLPLCFVQLLLPDIVVSFLLLSLHCWALLFYTACIVIAFVAVTVVVVAGVGHWCSCCCLC